MRFAMITAALGAAFLSVPAQATVFVVSIQGTVTGTKETFFCTGALTPSCLEASSHDFTLPLGTVDLVEGENTLTWGGYRTSGEYKFTIIRNGNSLTGVNLSYNYISCSGSPPPGCYAIYASAPTFNVTGGVPEPATWAMLLMGFGAMGAGLRRRERVVLA